MSHVGNGRVRHERAGGLDVRLVPISADQIKALESLERAFSVLADDFWHDCGADHDDRIAGGIYRLCSTLAMIVEQWRHGSEDIALVETRRRVLSQIALDETATPATRRLAAKALGAEPA